MLSAFCGVFFVVVVVVVWSLTDVHSLYISHWVTGGLSIDSWPSINSIPSANETSTSFTPDAPDSTPINIEREREKKPPRTDEMLTSL